MNVYSHPDEQAFWAAIQASPDDDTPLLVYADWLDEHSRYSEAAFLREMVEMAVLEGDDVTPTDTCFWYERARGIVNNQCFMGRRWMDAVLTPRFVKVFERFHATVRRVYTPGMLLRKRAEAAKGPDPSKSREEQIHAWIYDFGPPPADTSLDERAAILRSIGATEDAEACEWAAEAYRQLHRFLDEWEAALSQPDPGEALRNLMEEGS